MNSLAKKYYPLADAPNERELKDLQVEDQVGVRAVPTGEMRPPKSGEWFLSAAELDLALQLCKHFELQLGTLVRQPNCFTFRERDKRLGWPA